MITCECVLFQQVVIKDMEGRFHGAQRFHAETPSWSRRERPCSVSPSARTLLLTERSSHSFSKLEVLRDRMKCGKSTEGSLTSRPASSRPRRDSLNPPSVKHADEIDEVVQMYLSESDQLGRLKRLAYGIYSLGNKKIGISVKNGKPLVRIGGGAMVHLDVYLVTHS